MQVKKFEAKNMKEALLMVKKELGPDAIILSARDIKKGYGLQSEAGVELTAAISEEKLKERRYALAKLREAEKAKMLDSSARSQKKFIDKSVARYRQDVAPIPMNSASRKYIQIEDDEAPMSRENVIGQSVASSMADRDLGKTRVKAAAQMARTSYDPSLFEEPKKAAPQQQQQQLHSANYGPAKVTKASQAATSNVEVSELRNEIRRLNQVISGFSSVPQTFVSSHPGAEYNIPYELSFMYQKLQEAGIFDEQLVPMLEKAKKELDPLQMKKKPMVEGWAAKHILDTTRIIPNEIKTKLEVFLGGSGAGKTATIIKYASFLLLAKRRKIAIVTTDTQKLGAIEQLKIYAQILNVPFAQVRNQNDWSEILTHLRDVDTILVDTPGVSLKNIQEIDSLRANLQPIEKHACMHYVIPVTSKEQPAMELARRFKMFQIHDLIFTKLDESLQHGMIYSMQSKLELPLHSFGVGSRIPEDFEFATKERVLDLIFKITKNFAGTGE